MGVPALHGDWAGLVVFCAATSWDGIRLPDQHVAERLTRWVPVLYVDPPVSHATALRHPELAASLRPPRLRLLAPGLARLTPLAPPGKGRPAVRPVSNALRVRAMRRAVRALSGTVRAVVAASLDPVYQAFPEARHVLYGTDDYVAGSRLMGVARHRLAAAEERQLRRSDVVVAISPVLAERWRSMGYDVSLVPNGCDAAAFAAPGLAVPPVAVLDPPVAGFVGHLNARIDLGYLEAVAGRGLSLLVVGPRVPGFQSARLEALLARPNVHWVGAKPFADLPGYVAALDVGLVPYADTEFNRASFPLKTLEYLAAGKPVVATDLPSLRWVDSPHIALCTGYDDFAETAQRLATTPAAPADVAARRAVAAHHSWDDRAAEFARLLGLRR
ncbi:MAG: glycosyltransferase [Actinomycetes bacterium]